MDLRLSGQTAVVTGASRHRTRGHARLVAEGVQVTAGALKSSAQLDELPAPDQVRVTEVDLAEPGGLAALVAAAGDRIDVLVNNVGARPGGLPPTCGWAITGSPRASAARPAPSPRMSRARPPARW